MQPLKIFIVEDDYSYRVCYKDFLDHRVRHRDPIEFVFAESFDEFKLQIDAAHGDGHEDINIAVWTDHRIVGKMTGADVALYTTETYPEVVCISMSSLREGTYPPGVPRLRKTFKIRNLYLGTLHCFEHGEEPEWYLM